MSAIVEPDEEEKYLLAILADESGLDIAEFMWIDEEKEDGRFRAWDFQWDWYADDSALQIDQCGRAVGKSNGVQMRAFAFPFSYAQQEMLLTAPELNHLRPLVDAVEQRILSSRLATEMLPRSKGNGISRQPHWQARFVNGSRIISRLPNKDGKGVKGMHPLKLEADEMQDYPLAGWVELIETLKRGSVGAQWRCHGVSRGVRDKYYELTHNPSWTVHRKMAMHRPNWTEDEREEKIVTYGGSRQNPDYKRNIYGEHGDATNPVFVLARLMDCVDQEPGSEFNTDVFTEIRITFEELNGRQPVMFMDLPGTHRAGWTKAPRGYSAYYAGMDVGATNHPSEILVAGQRAGASREQLDMLLRVHMQRISMDDQFQVVQWLMNWYGSKLQTFGIDRTGLGFPLWERMEKAFPNRTKGYNFSAKYAVALEDRPLEDGEDLDDLVIERNIVEFSTDALREIVDSKGLQLPFNRELLTEWQGQNYVIVKTAQNPYGKRAYSDGSFHTLDAGKMLIAGKRLQALDEALAHRPQRTPVLDAFVGGYV